MLVSVYEWRMCASVGVSVGEGGSGVSVSVRGWVWEIFGRYRFCGVLGLKCVRVRIRVRFRVLAIYFQLIMRMLNVLVWLCMVV